METPTFQFVRRAALRINPRNSRTHSKKQTRKIANSIEQFGWTNPILVDEHNIVLAGHGRLAAAALLHIDDVPILQIRHLTEAQKRAYVIADNKLALDAGWDIELLTSELGVLADLLPDAGLDLQLTGFDAGELDALLSVAEDALSVEDEVPRTQTTPVTQPGDIWLAGKHRILCGDARDPDAFGRLMSGAQATMVFTDPPYNVRVREIQGRGKLKHKDFVMGSGEMSSLEFIELLETTLGLCAAHSINGAIHFVCMDWRHLPEILDAGKAVYQELKNICVWVKTNAGQGSFYRSQHELVLLFKNGTADHINNFGLGQNGRHRSNVWTYAGINAFRAGRMEELGMHPTVKPVSLVADAIRDCSRRGSVILDAFLGSGTTIIAAEQTGRAAYGLEIDPGYVDVALRRWQNLTRRDAVLDGSQVTFDELSADRSSRPGAESGAK